MDDLFSKLLGIREGIRSEEGQMSLEWQDFPAAWVFLLLVVGCLGLFLYIYGKERKDVSAGPKAVLAVLRALVIIIILLMLFRPMLTIDITREKKSVLIVLVDESLSMSKKDPRPKDEKDLDALARVTGLSREEVVRLTRIELVNRALANKETMILDTLEGRMKVHYFAFAKTARSVKKEDMTALQAAGGETAIGDALKHALTVFREERVAAVLVISDGRNNTGLDPREVCRELQKNYIPVFTVAPGIPQAPMDIALLEMEAPDAVLVNDPVLIKFGVMSRGFEGKNVQVEFFVYPLKNENEDLPRSPEEIEKRIADARREQTLPVTLKGGDTPDPKTIEFRPTSMGTFELILRIEPNEDEITRKNNYVTHKLRVADDKVRVLYVEYPPRYEYKYLQNALKRDNTVLFHALLTSADRDFAQEHSTNISPSVSPEDREYYSRPLQEFPHDLKQLVEKYDVILLGDVDPAAIGGDQDWDNIKKFVYEFGGGVVFLTGLRSNPESYAHTSLQDLLLVEPLDRAPEGEKFEEPLAYALTKEGLEHPVISFSADKERNRKIWESADGLPRLFWYKRVGNKKANAQVLVELTTGHEGGARHPLFVSGFYGRGRVFMSLTDETWRWRLSTGDAPYFFPFWKKVIHWVREGRLHGSRRFRIEVDKERYAVGEPVKIFVWAYDQNYQPVKDQQIEFHVVPPAGEQKSDFLKLAQADRSGYFEGQFIPKDVGPHRIWVGDPLDDKERSSDQFEVYVPNREEEDPRIDETMLSMMAQESGSGSYLRLPDLPKVVDQVKEVTLRVTDRKEDEIWDSPLAFLLFALLITLEWIIRKIFRML